MKGFEHDLYEMARARVRIPVIASGGACGAAHVLDLMANPRADAVCCASIFHYDIAPLPELKRAWVDAVHEMRR